MRVVTFAKLNCRMQKIIIGETKHAIEAIVKKAKQKKKKCLKIYLFTCFMRFWINLNEKAYSL